MTEKRLMEEEYARYIARHRNNVASAWRLVDTSLKKTNHWVLPRHDATIDRLVNIHDMSKFSSEEFDGYRQFFYPCTGETPSKEQFDIAWQHHLAHNPHHWQNLKLDALEQTAPYVVEMVCDHLAMAMWFEEPMRKYWDTNHATMGLPDRTHEFVEEIYLAVEQNLEALRMPWDEFCKLFAVSKRKTELFTLKENSK